MAEHGSTGGDISGAPDHFYEDGLTGENPEVADSARERVEADDAIKTEETQSIEAVAAKGNSIYERRMGRELKDMMKAYKQLDKEPPNQLGFIEYLQDNYGDRDRMMESPTLKAAYNSKIKELTSELPKQPPLLDIRGLPRREDDQLTAEAFNQMDAGDFLNEAGRQKKKVDKAGRELLAVDTGLFKFGKKKELITKAKNTYFQAVDGYNRIGNQNNTRINRSEMEGEKIGRLNANEYLEEMRT